MRYLSRSQLGVKFIRQMPIGPWFADFLCRECRLVVELDGFSHELRCGHDAARDAWLAREGYRVLRIFQCGGAAQCQGCVSAIREAVRGGPPRCG